MRTKVLLYDPLSWLRNAGFFLLGASFYIALHGTAGMGSLGIALLGFLLAYTSVYFFNDLLDYRRDVKDEVKKLYKPLISGEASKKSFVLISMLYALSGISLSFYFGTFFGLMVSLLLFLNVLHSTVFRANRTVRSVSIMVIEFVKISLGWFAFSSLLTGFPFLFVVFVCMLYSFGYRLYKTDLKNVVSERNMLFSAMLKGGANKAYTFVMLASFLLSFLIYPFRLPLLIFLAFAALNMIAQKKIKLSGEGSKSFVKNLNFSHLVVIICCFVLILGFIGIAVSPEMAQLNGAMGQAVEPLSSAVYSFWMGIFK